ncbi:MAG: acetyl-CoA decarbonylase/synthase complex subunit delta [Thermoplasmata archaeon]|nr:MAG: acetyl-CoA decarbonylase/synthase complex subunit delta [Thermoplasmata archaeon]
MAVELPVEKWSGKISEITIGATKDDGGTRTSTVTIGGQNTLPYLHFEGEMPHKAAIAMEVLDVLPEDYPELLKKAFGDAVNNPAEWAKKCVEEYKADLICLKLVGTNPEEADRSPEEAVETLKSVLEAVGVPLIVYGCGHDEKDAKVLEAVSNAAKGERLALGLAEEDRYKSISVAAMSNKHVLVAFSNLDINLAKQMNILLTDFDVKLGDIIMDPLQAGLGYGLEYSYSVIERIRIAALMGDKMLQVPIVCDAGVSWKAREAHMEDPSLGDPEKRGPFWETTTAVAALTSGADMLIMKHPEAVQNVKKVIDDYYESRVDGGEL